METKSTIRKTVLFALEKVTKMNEVICPCCGNKIKQIRVRRAYIKELKSKRGHNFVVVKGVYKWIKCSLCSKGDSK